MNIWSRFNSIDVNRYETPILVCTLLSSEPGNWNRSVVELPGGAQLSVSGGGTPGQRYFITRTSANDDWRLDGEAPSLPFLTIEI